MTSGPPRPKRVLRLKDFDGETYVSTADVIAWMSANPGARPTSFVRGLSDLVSRHRQAKPHAPFSDLLTALGNLARG